jgi:mono/diheme cytochrome c family protein
MIVTLAAAVALVLALAVAPASAAAPVGDPARGATLYGQKCAVCHGAAGGGDGPAEFVLFPRPRDLTSGRFKIRSTPTLPTDDDLFRVITNGIPGTAMPGWSVLTEGERRDLVAHVKTLSPVFGQGPAPKPITIPPAPKPTPELLALGKKFYAEAECLKCHGAGGRGDGESADTLRDEWGQPIVPYDFTVAGRMKAGNTVADVYRTLVNGIGGTPMPAFGDALSPEETWGLAYYVMSLARTPKRAPAAETATVRVRRVAGVLPRDPNAAAWRGARPRPIALRTLWLRPAQVSEVRVAALHNGREIAFLLEWDDPRADASALGIADFRDAAAVQFPVHPVAPLGAGRPEPSYVMGDRGGPVNIWHWKSDWQLDLARYRDREDRHPNVIVDSVPFVRGMDAADGRAAVQPVDRQDPLFLTGLAAGNPMSRARASAVESLAAVGVGSITSQPLAAQTVRGEGRWADGRWRLVIVRALRTEHAGDAQFAPGQAGAVAFAVWDGAQRDRNGQKAVSVWQRLTLDR